MPAPDWMGDLLAWLQANWTPLSGRVYFREPTKPATYPIARLYRSGGGAEQSGEFPVFYNVRVGIEVWGNAFQMYDQVREATVALESLLNDAPSQPLNPPSGTTWLHSATVTMTVDSPDPDSGWPRIVADVVLTVSLIS